MDYLSRLPPELVERILCSNLLPTPADNPANDGDDDENDFASVGESCSRPFADYVVPAATHRRYLTPRDLSAFAQTCRRHSDLVRQGGRVWQTAFARTYPHLARKIADGRGCDNISDVDWRTEMMDRRRLEKALITKIEAMSDLHYHKPDLSDDDFGPLIDLEDSFGHDFVLDALRHALNKEDNLTTLYYGNKAFKHLQFVGLARKMKELVRSKRPDPEKFEQGMLIIAETFQPEKFIPPDTVKDFLDEVEEEVREQLRLKHPDNPALKTEEDRVWTKKSQLHALDALNEVLYDVQFMGLRGNSTQYYDPRNVFVDEVVSRRTGMPIALCVLYLLCAHRLGIRCEGVNYPSHFVLACRKPGFGDGDHGEEEFFIDAFEGGKRMCLGQLTDGDLAIVKGGPREVFFRILRNLLSIIRNPMLPDRDELNRFIQRRCYELFLVMRLEDEPHDALVANVKKGLSQVYLELNANHDFILDNAHLWGSQPLGHAVPDDDEEDGQASQGMAARVKKECQAQLKKIEENRPRKPKQRPPVIGDRDKDVLYTVGMVMRHRKYHYDCVISGWDHKCKAERAWIMYMGVDKLRLKEHQPFYHVLVGDGSNRYAAQENLRPLSARAAPDVDHPEVGKYFARRVGSHYELNAECKEVYPEDEEYRRAKFP